MSNPETLEKHALECWGPQFSDDWLRILKPLAKAIGVIRLSQ